MGKSGCTGRGVGRVAAWIGGCAAGLALMAMPVQAQERSQTRSMVLSTLGIVATESPLAAQAGVSILAKGGQCGGRGHCRQRRHGVVAPMSNGIGGDLFAIVYEAKSGKLYGLNAGGWSPRALTPAYLQARGVTAMPLRGVHAITVPGTVDDWARLQEAVRTALGALGHQLKVRGDFALAATGGGQVTLRDLASGVNYGASDPRKDGAAVAESF